jgi:hypothetical protein
MTLQSVTHRASKNGFGNEAKYGTGNDEDSGSYMIDGISGESLGQQFSESLAVGLFTTPRNQC